MKGYLVDNYMVDICPETTEFGGSWEGDYRMGYPVAYGQDSLRYVYDFFAERHGGTMIDVGASTGSFSLLPAILGPSLRVHAFEPNPWAYNILMHNIKANRIGTVVDHCAVGQYWDVGQLLVPTDNRVAGLAHLGFNKGRIEGSAASVVVPIVPLDAFDIEPDFIKIDTEGYELFVLQGAAKIIDKYRPTILMEFEERNIKQHGYHSDEILGWLKLLNYSWEKFGDIDLLCKPL